MTRRAQFNNPFDKPAHTKRRNQLRARGIIIRCKRGGILTKVLSSGRRAQFFVDGIKVRTREAHAAIASGELISSHDGFFGTAQTWRAQPSNDDRTRAPRRVRPRNSMAGFIKENSRE
jgi:hypothetical protein